MAKIEDCPGFETFGADVKAARKAKQLSRSALADMIHCDSRYLANIENEGTLPSLPVVIQLIKICGLPVERYFNPELMREESAERQRVSHKLQLCPEEYLPIRNELTDEWKKRGVQKGKEYAILTDEISRAWSGMTTGQYKRLKGLTKENLRDNMTDLELVLTMLAEASTTDISKTAKPQTFEENKQVAKRGGKVAGIARQALEAETGKPVITEKNMRQMEMAPFLKADGLEDGYKVLADFNGTVLAGVQSKHGVHFVTWDWAYGHTGVCHGHYFMENYAGAKQDFAIRSGLIQKERLFTPEQMTEIYRCCADSVDGDFFELTGEQEKMIRSVQQQIEECVPDLDERIRQQEEALEQVAQQQTM